MKVAHAGSGFVSNEGVGESGEDERGSSDRTTCSVEERHLNRLVGEQAPSRIAGSPPEGIPDQEGLVVLVLETGADDGGRQPVDGVAVDTGAARTDRRRDEQRQEADGEAPYRAARTSRAFWSTDLLCCRCFRMSSSTTDDELRLMYHARISRSSQSFMSTL